MILNDLKYALRLLAKKPSFAALTVFVIAAGIGLSVFLFSFFNTIIFKDLPFKNSASLLQINRYQNASFTWGGLGLHDLEEIRGNLSKLAQIGAYTNTRVNGVGPDGARRYVAVNAEANFFSFTQVKPLMGRLFTSQETQDGSDPVAVISYGLWQHQFGGAKNVLQQTLHINGQSTQIIGVMPDQYAFPNNADLWLPLYAHAAQLELKTAPKVYGIAMLVDGVSATEFNQKLALVMQRVAANYPDTNNDVGAKATPFPMTDMEDGIAIIYTLQIAALLILLLASINVGNLLFTRAIERNKETAIRIALGAPRMRLIGQMLWESLIICLLGGTIGLLSLAWGLEFAEATVATFFSEPLPFWWEFGIDAYTLKIFTFALLITFTLTGILPAWKNSNSDFNAVIRDGTRGAQSRYAARLNSLLVIGEIFISVTILIASATAIYAAYKASHLNYGADTKDIVLAKIELDEGTYSTQAKRLEFFHKLDATLSSHGEVTETMFISALPGEWTSVYGVEIEGQEYSDTGPLRYPQANFITPYPGALEKLQVGLIQGRFFQHSDNQPGQLTAIVSENFAKRYLQGQTALGKRIKVHRDPQHEPEWLTIVGVVENTIQGDANDMNSRHPSVFQAYGQTPKLDMTLAVKSSHEAVTIEKLIRTTLQSIDKQLPAFQIESYDGLINRNGAPLQFISNIFMLFGFAALLLSASGIYGVMANTISQKTQEIGVKRALGAQDKNITRELLWRGAKQILWGGIPGICAGVGLGFGISLVLNVDKAVLFVIAATMITLIGCVVLFATYVPTRKALTLDPMDALRYE